MGSVGSVLNLDSSYLYTAPHNTALSPPQLPPTSHHHHRGTIPSLVLSTPVSSKRKAALPVNVPAPKKAAISMAQQLPMELGEYIARDVKLLQQLGWSGLVKQCRPVSCQ